MKFLIVTAKLGNMIQYSKNYSSTQDSESFISEEG